MIRFLLLLLPLLSACGWMWDQPKVKAFREAPLKVEVSPERVRFGENLNPEVRLGLKPEGGFAENPFAFTEEDLLRGKVLYRSFCAICHGLNAQGDGRVIPLGVPRPRSFHDPGVKAMPEAISTSPPPTVLAACSPTGAGSPSGRAGSSPTTSSGASSRRPVPWRW